MPPVPKSPLLIDRGVRLLRSSAMGEGGPSDPHWASVMLYARFNGNLVDEAGRHVLSHNGDSRTLLGQGFNGVAEPNPNDANTSSVHGVTAPSSADWELGAGNWTIEYRVRIPNVATASFRGLVDCRQDATLGNLWQCWYKQNFDEFFCRFTFKDTSTSGFDIFGPGIVLGNWASIAFSRNGTALRCFINGIEKGNNVIGAGADLAFNVGQSARLSVGFGTQIGTVTDCLAGTYFDELRITKGVGRYTGNYTPATDEFGNHP